MSIPRSLITFAFVADSFVKSGDIVSGLEPLFAPILHRHKGKQYDPQAFASEISDTYGVRMHPFVALDLAPKLEKLGLLHAIQKDGAVAGYIILDKGYSFADIKEEQIDSLTQKFFNFTKARAALHSLDFTETELEEALYERLITMEFLSISARDQPSYLQPTTLRLKKAVPNEEPISEEAKRALQLDFLCADFVDELYRTDHEGFELLADVSCGALLAEVVLGLRTPPSTGQDGSGVTIYFDAPFIMNLLGLTDPVSKQYAELLFLSAKDSKADLGCFTHNVEEIEANIDAPLHNLKNHLEVFGPTGRLLLQGGPGAAYVLSIRRDVKSAVQKLGIKIVDMANPDNKGSEKFYPPSQENELASHLGMYQNVYARLRDAASIANIIRLRGDRSLTATLFGSRAVFVTTNPRLVHRSTSYLSREQKFSIDSFPPVITDRFLAGILWVAQGGKGADMPKRKLLANCTSAMRPRRDVVTRMYSFLDELNPELAKHFEALIANDRCAYYLMEQTLGDRDLLTLENCKSIYSNIERATAEKVIQEKESEIAAIKEEHQGVVSSLEGDREVDREKIEGLTEEISRLKAHEHALSDALIKAARDKRAIEERDITLCVVAGQNAGFRFIFLVGVVYVVISVAIVLLHETLKAQVQGDAFTYGVVASVFVLFLALLNTCATPFIGFWKIPDLLFGKALKRSRMKGFRKKALELKLTTAPETLEIDWTKGEYASPQSSIPSPVPLAPP